jgi:plasmid stabilization system protein ParE
MRIAWTAEAVAELDSMLAYIAAQDPSAASLVAERVLQAESGIQTFPRAGNYDPETDTFDRYIPKTRIVLTYAIRDDAIWIVAAWHTSRDPATKPKREP